MLLDTTRYGILPDIGGSPSNIYAKHSILFGVLKTFNDLALISTTRHVLMA
jgi:hypothetical protein